MAIVISGVNNNDKITASDGTIDLLSGVNYIGIITAPAISATGNLTAASINVDNNIQLGTAGIVTATTFVGNVTGNINNSTLLLQTGGTERLRIDSNGTLRVQGGDGNAYLQLERYQNNDKGGRVRFVKSRSDTVGLNTIVQDGDTLGVIDFYGSDSNLGTRGAASISAEVDGTPGSADMPGRLIFKTVPDNSTVFTERLRITSDGKMGVGTTNPSTILHLSDGSNDCDLTVQATASGKDARINLYANSGGVSQIRLGDESSGNVGLITYDHSDNNLALRTNSTEKLRIKSGGDILTQGLTSPSFDNQGTNGRKYEFTGDGTAGKFPVINISGNSNTDGGTIGVLRFVNRENANSSSGNNNQSRGLVELDVRSTTSDSNAGDDSGGYIRFITKSEEGTMGERFVLTARGSFKSNGRHNLGGIREITSGTLANGESVSWNGSGTTYTNAALNWNSIGGNGGSWIGSLSVLSADQSPSGAMVLVGCHGSGFNTYNMLVNAFDSGISVTPTGTGASGNYWNSVISNTSGETIYYRMLVYHLGASTETIFGL
tara:strand:+ start:1968 stop:3611 length:1644 start_codon:yes stop_codon:yes gene_type:complete